MHFSAPVFWPSGCAQCSKRSTRMHQKRARFILVLRMWEEGAPLRKLWYWLGDRGLRVAIAAVVLVLAAGAVGYAIAAEDPDASLSEDPGVAPAERDPRP